MDQFSSHFVSGSTVEGQSYAKHYCADVQDIDIMLKCGEICSQDDLIPTSVPGFVYVKAQQFPRLLKDLGPNGILCVNGFGLKETHVKHSEALDFCTAQTSVETASVATRTTGIDVEMLHRLFENTLRKVAAQRHKNNRMWSVIHDNFLRRVDIMKEYANLFESHGSLIGHYFTHMLNRGVDFAGPAFGIQLSDDLRGKARAMIDYYLKFKHLVDVKRGHYFRKFGAKHMSSDFDLVPSLQLKFWPHDLLQTIQRLKMNKPQLYEKIQHVYMHVIPKWSKKTDARYSALEFRYSFSAIELIIAQQRSRNEKILSGIARNIYYKYLKQTDKYYIPSYFIKTTVLWMCETQDLTLGGETEYDQITQQLASMWIRFACEKLRCHLCEHYFIDKVNILELYSYASLEDAHRILQEIDYNILSSPAITRPRSLFLPILLQTNTGTTAIAKQLVKSENMMHRCIALTDLPQTDLQHRSILKNHPDGPLTEQDDQHSASSIHNRFKSIFSKFDPSSEFDSFNQSVVDQQLSSPDSSDLYMSVLPHTLRCCLLISHCNTIFKDSTSTLHSSELSSTDPSYECVMTYMMQMYNAILEMYPELRPDVTKFDGSNQSIAEANDYEQGYQFALQDVEYKVRWFVS
ncbi:unnamed protein product [Didymodactylos carnosus]|uniref:Mab-21-like HhH/H2TH-like domain-containing protein n=1 Tax=Didymodactylos carnosus TaxID=1234261 RepID=A0A813WAE4_9BILA|nr:unnamed protein product [Didymodactylos carnosus]CAF3642435.1 unnamed protein product [Didymodactylos carnosus]